jgi:hypothetical protein
MSRTDVHRPWHIQLADPHNRHLFYRFQVWPWQTELIPFKNLGCGCRMCTDQPARKRARRQERHDIRRALHDATAQYAAQDLDEDLPARTAPPPGDRLGVR